MKTENAGRRARCEFQRHFAAANVLKLVLYQPAF